MTGKEGAKDMKRLFCIFLLLSLMLSAFAFGEKPESAPPVGEFSSVDELAHKKIGVPTGAVFDQLVEKRLPEAELCFFNSDSDLVGALEAGKIDAFATDEPVVAYMMNQNNKLTYLTEYLETFDFAYLFPKDEKGGALRDEMDAYLQRIRADGTMDRIAEIWFGTDESLKVLPEENAYTGEKGKLRMAVMGDYPPFAFIRNNEVVGYDIDMAARFCVENGYRLEIVVLSSDGMLPAVQSGKCDFGGSGMAITAEREQTMYFSQPNYTGGVVLAVRRTGAAGAEDTSFFGGLKSSFEKTFLREERWRLFLEGVGNTLLITLLSILCGTALGFGVYLLCRKGNPAANLITRFCVWLVQGMPMVVLLMVLFYIVFGKSSLGGLGVAVIGFTLTFAAAVIGILKNSVGAVDKGQREAACALGFTERQSFFRFVLPQALPHALSPYKGEVMGLIKATAVVGYIAVQDLTKVGDIVRSRTYEAFFPLIAVTVIYFLLEGIFSFLFGRIERKLDPRRRKPEQILKKHGVAPGSAVKKTAE